MPKNGGELKVIEVNYLKYVLIKMNNCRQIIKNEIQRFFNEFLTIFFLFKHILYINLV